MASEIEAKFKIEDIQEIREKLRKINAELKGTKNQTDTYYKHSKKEELKDSPTYLRVRTQDGKSKVAMHYKLKEYEWEELETATEEGEIIRKIFENLGFQIDVEIIKKTS